MNLNELSKVKSIEIQIKDKLTKYNITRNQILIIHIFIAFIISIFTWFFLNTFFYIVFIFILLSFLPWIYIYIKEYLEAEELENRFPIFLRDLSHYITIGQTLPIALKSVRSNSYGKIMDRELNKILAEMSIGIPFTDALERMVHRIPSEKIKKALLAIIEAERYGGKMSYALIAMSETMNKLNEIKKERISKIRSFTINYYFIYIGFVIIIFIIGYLFKTYFKIDMVLLESYKRVASLLIIMNGILTGIVIGKTSMGKISAGIIHSIILTLIGVIILMFL